MTMGSRHERAFVRMLVDTGHWSAQRAATSGSGTDADLPDVTFADDGHAFAAEQKTRDGPHIYVDEAEVEKLTAYADDYGMLPCVIGRFGGERAYYVWHPGDMTRTDAGTYRGSPDDEHWSAKVAHPDGGAEGIDPGGLRGYMLYEWLASPFDWGRVAAPSQGGVGLDA